MCDAIQNNLQLIVIPVYSTHSKFYIKHYNFVFRYYYANILCNNVVRCAFFNENFIILYTTVLKAVICNSSIGMELPFQHFFKQEQRVKKNCQYTLWVLLFYIHTRNLLCFLGSDVGKLRRPWSFLPHSRKSGPSLISRWFSVVSATCNWCLTYYSLHCISRLNSFGYEVC